MNSWCTAFITNAMASHELSLQEILKLNLLIIDGMGMKQLAKRSVEWLFEISIRSHRRRAWLYSHIGPLSAASGTDSDHWPMLLAEKLRRIQKVKSTHRLRCRRNVSPKAPAHRDLINNWYLLKRPHLVPFQASPGSMSGMANRRRRLRCIDVCLRVWNYTKVSTAQRL